MSFVNLFIGTGEWHGTTQTVPVPYKRITELGSMKGPHWNTLYLLCMIDSSDGRERNFHRPCGLLLRGRVLFGEKQVFVSGTKCISTDISVC